MTEGNRFELLNSTMEEMKTADYWRKMINTLQLSEIILDEDADFLSEILQCEIVRDLFENMVYSSQHIINKTIRLKEKIGVWEEQAKQISVASEEEIARCIEKKIKGAVLIENDLSKILGITPNISIEKMRKYAEEKALYMNKHAVSFIVLYLIFEDQYQNICDKAEKDIQECRFMKEVGMVTDHYSIDISDELDESPIRYPVLYNPDSTKKGRDYTEYYYDSNRCLKEAVRYCNYNSPFRKRVFLWGNERILEIGFTQNKTPFFFNYFTYQNGLIVEKKTVRFSKTQFPASLKEDYVKYGNTSVSDFVSEIMMYPDELEDHWNRFGEPPIFLERYSEEEYSFIEDQKGKILSYLETRTEGGVRIKRNRPEPIKAGIRKNLLKSCDRWRIMRLTD